MINKPIAVITNNIPVTYQWLRETYKVDLINTTLRTASCSKDKKEYVLISDKEQALAWEFSGYIVSPFYESLEQTVRSRVR